MLNQLEQTNIPHENTDSKDSAGSTTIQPIIDTDSAKESGEPCARCKSRSNVAAAKRNVNQRAKVTVQRRANTNQKVVSLSFDKAVELTKIDSKRNGGKPLSSFKLQDGEAEQGDDEGVRPKAGCEASAENEKTIVTTLNFSNEGQEKASDVISLTSSDKPEACLHEDDVVSFFTSEDDPQHLAPPPIRLRQAWASPTQARQQRTTSTTQCKETNTEPRRQDKHSRKSTTELPAANGNAELPADHKPECGSGDTCVSHVDENSGPEIEGSSTSGESPSQANDQPTKTPTTSSSRSKQKQRKRPQGNQCAVVVSPSTQSESKKNATKSTNRKKKTGVARSDTESEYKNEATTSIHVKEETGHAEGEVVKSADSGAPIKSTADLKNHGMGDAENITENKETRGTMDKTDSGTHSANTDPSTPKNNSETVAAKQKKKKKISASLFSWPLFKRKAVLKQKTSDSKLVDSSNQTLNAGYVARTSMADILYMQGRVSMPQSLTAMFAASHPEKAVAAQQDHQKPK